jgi:hypothetical protein
MAGLRTVSLDVLPRQHVDVLAVPLAALAATLLASLAVGLCLSRGKPGGPIPAGVLFLAACRRAAKEHARTRGAV